MPAVCSAGRSGAGRIRFREPTRLPPPNAIVVLGAGAKTIHGQWRKVVVLTPTGAFRVLEAVRVFELLGEP